LSLNPRDIEEGSPRPQRPGKADESGSVRPATVAAFSEPRTPIGATPRRSAEPHAAPGFVGAALFPALAYDSFSFDKGAPPPPTSAPPPAARRE
jgi:hypothetical protein